MHSTVRISSFRWTFAGHCRLIFYSISTSKISFKRSLFYLNIDVCSKKFVSKWDSYGHSKLGKSKGAVTSPYQLSGEVLGHRGNVAKLNAVVYSSTEQVLDRSSRWSLHNLGGWWVDRLQNDCRTPWCLRGFPGTSAPTLVETGIELIRRSHSALWLTRLRMAIAVSFRNEFSKQIHKRLGKRERPFQRYFTLANRTKNEPTVIVESSSLSWYGEVTAPLDLPNLEWP